MFAIMMALVPAVLVAVVVMAYVAYPHRGERMPLMPGLGEVMRRGVDALPTLGDDTADDLAEEERTVERSGVLPG